MKVLFFAPHSAIWIHAFPEALIAQALREGGHEILYVTCGRQLKAGCIAMSAHGVKSDSPPEEKERICRKCEGYKRVLQQGFGFRGCDLSDLLEPEEIARVGDLVNAATPDTFLGLKVMDVEVGRLALYEFLLDHKKSTLVFENDQEWKRYQAALENALYVLYAGARLMAREAPDAVVVYNGLYAVNRTICKLAAANGIPHYFMHAGGNLAHRLQALMVGKGDIFDLMRNAKDAWESRRDIPLDPAVAPLITDHFLELLKGWSAFAYSSPKGATSTDLREKFGILPAQKVLCATLSSYDERFAAETIGARPVVTDALFPMQADWIQAMIDYVRGRADRYLIVRVHPREFPNKREGVKSEHAHRLEVLLRDLPSNVAINWPADNISLYDLAEITDVFLNAWSSVGKEMSLLGIPVVLYSPELPMYPADLNYLGTTLPAYFAAIEAAIADGWRYENILRTYRWCSIEYGSMLIDISDAYSASESPPTGLGARAAAKLLRSLDPYRVQRRDVRRRADPIRASGQINRLFESGAQTVLDPRVGPPAVAAVTPIPEADVVRAEIGRLLNAMYPSGNPRVNRLGNFLADLAASPHAQ